MKRAAVLLLLLLVAGCAGRQRHPLPIEEPATIERPARPLNEEEGLGDRIGQVGVVLLVVVITVGGILLPILLL